MELKREIIAFERGKNGVRRPKWGKNRDLREQKKGIIALKQTEEGREKSKASYCTRDRTKASDQAQK